MKLILNFLKNELFNFEKYEGIIFSLLLILIFLSSIFAKDNPIATANAFFSFLYTVLAGKGRVLCYYFGIIGTLCYSYLTFKNSLFGNLVLYLGYYFPMEIIGIFSWKKHLKNNSNEIQKTYLSNKNRTIILILIIIFSLLAGFILKYFKDKYPFLDAFITVLSIAGMYLTVKRCIEQWIIWTCVNLLSIILWLLIFINGGKTFATLLIWIIYFFLGIYFFYKWKTEINKQ